MKIRLSREEILFLYARGLRDFRWVDLSNLDLREINLMDSDIRGVSFKGSMIREAVFAFCKAQGAKFNEAIGYDLADVEGIEL